MIAKKLPCFEFSCHLVISSLFFSKRKGAETSRCHWLWTFRFSLCGRFMPWIRSNQSKLRSSKDSRAINISAALESEQVLLFQQPLVEFPITYILRRTVPIFCECRLPNDKKEHVQCSQCCSWYHPNCVMVPEWAIKTKRKCQKGKNSPTK